VKIFNLFRIHIGIEQEIGHANNAVHGRSDLVIQFGNEFRFGAICGVTGCPCSCHLSNLILAMCKVLGNPDNMDQLAF
jgi:hypothetical protein